MKQLILQIVNLRMQKTVLSILSIFRKGILLVERPNLKDLHTTLYKIVFNAHIRTDDHEMPFVINKFYEEDNNLKLLKVQSHKLKKQ